MKFEDGPPDDAAVAQGLSALKREGGSVLVVGPVRDSHDDVCERFLAVDEADGADDRDADVRRVYVHTEGELQADADAAAVIERPVKTRSVASASPSPTGIESISRELRSTMERFGDDEGSLRVCFDSLRPFVDSTPAPELASALESLRGSARKNDAVLHVHLPAMVEAVPEPLYDAVDAVVEVTRRGESTYQQWHLPSADRTSEWVLV